MPREAHKGDTARIFIRQTLRRTRLFAAWPEPALEALSDAGRVQVCSPGETLARRGEKVQTLRIVASGWFETSRTWADGRRMVVNLAQANELIDVAAIFDDEPAMFDLTARGAATLVAVPHRVIRDLVERNPALALTLIEALSRKARADAERLQAGLVNSPRVRLAKTLISLSAERPRESAPQLQVTQDDLAAMLGLSRQSVVSAMKPLVRDGVIETRYRSIRLVDPARLEAVALEEEEVQPPPVLAQVRAGLD